MTLDEFLSSPLVNGLDESERAAITTMVAPAVRDLDTDDSLLFMSAGNFLRAVHVMLCTLHAYTREQQRVKLLN